MIQHVSVVHSFFVTGNLPLYGYTFYVSIYWLIDIWAVYFLAIIILLWTFVCKFLWRHMFLFLKYISRVELLGHMATLCLTFWGTAKLFSTATVPFYISTSSAWEVQFFYIHNTCYYIFLIIASYWVWSGIVVWICISLMANDVQHLFKCLLAICVFSFEKGLVRSFVHILPDYLPFSY